VKTPQSNQPAATPKEKSEVAKTPIKTPIKTPKNDEEAKTPIKSEAAKSVAKAPSTQEVVGDHKIATPNGS